MARTARSVQWQTVLCEHAWSLSTLPSFNERLSVIPSTAFGGQIPSHQPMRRHIRMLHQISSLYVSNRFGSLHDFTTTRDRINAACESQSDSPFSTKLVRSVNLPMPWRRTRNFARSRFRKVFLRMIFEVIQNKSLRNQERRHRVSYSMAKELLS
eukprot:4217794-Pleurochrysis_carterae.AAC.4